MRAIHDGRAVGAVLNFSSFADAQEHDSPPVIVVSRSRGVLLRASSFP